ncbi:MAG: hypothetical protein H7123_04760 [Thermoleophilia bacterium]|nr:hypothetical protein [Thermoleophilia bacterium]
MYNALTYDRHTATIAIQDSVLAGAPLGRRERTHGSLSTIMDLQVETVVDAVADLAVADRVAWVMTRRTGLPHVVVSTGHTYIIATTNLELTAEDAQGLTVNPTLAIVTIATPHGMVPVFPS